ncbi:MAG: CRISPR-associated protein Cas4 [Pseudomonadota bacterium]
MVEESEYLMLSALQHILFCKRQCALIHLEQLWVENRYTAEGRILHERVDRGDSSTRGRIRVEYGMPLKSSRLGLSGIADVVEFHLQDTPANRWEPFPVEYKRGKPKKDLSDKVQLCAQALCLEEMLKTPVEKGALYYGKTRHRYIVDFDDGLRQVTVQVSADLHDMIRTGITPEPHYEKKCDTCSFIRLCMPKTMGKKRSVTAWVERMTLEE